MKNEESVLIASGLWECFNERRWDDTRKLLDDGFEAYWPQSNEKIPSPDKFIQVNRDYPGTHKIQVIGHQHSLDRWEFIDHITTEVFIRSTTPEGKEITLFAISYFEIQEGKILSLKEYWAETYSAPEWRKHLVEHEDQNSLLALGDGR